MIPTRRREELRCTRQGNARRDLWSQNGKEVLLRCSGTGPDLDQPQEPAILQRTTETYWMTSQMGNIHARLQLHIRIHPWRNERRSRPPKPVARP